MRFASIKRLLREHGAALIITSLALSFSLLLQLKLIWSPMFLGTEAWDETIQRRLVWYPFSIRYFQSYATLFVNWLTGLSCKTSFFSIQYLLALIMGPLFAHYLRLLNFSRAWSLVGVVLLFTAFPIMGAHFAPVNTWDDFWLYLFSILTFITLIRRRWFWSTLFFTLGCFAREQMVLFFPIYAGSIWWLSGRLTLSRRLLCLALPIAVYGLFHWFTMEAIDPKRWELFSFNFANPERAADSVTSLLNVFGFMWVLALVAVVRLSRSKLAASERLYFWGTITTVPLTVLVALMFTFAREMRIMFPPFLFVVPMALWTLQYLWVSARRRFTPLHWSILAIITAGLIYGGLEIAPLIWPVSDYLSSWVVRRWYAGLHLGLMAAFTFALIGTGLANRTHSSCAREETP